MKELLIMPRDGIFVKDGRGWHTSSLGRASALDWPHPRTIRGALRTAWGRLLEIRESRAPLTPNEWREETDGVSLGTTLAMRRVRGRDWSTEHRMWPVPEDAACLESPPEHGAAADARPVYKRLSPEPPPEGVTVSNGLDEDAWNSLMWPRLDDEVKPLAKPRWWPESTLVSWLAGDVKMPRYDLNEIQRLTPAKRVDAHVAIDRDTLTAAESMLYTTEVVEPLGKYDEWALAAAVDLPDDSDLTTIPLTLGGKRRLCQIHDAPGLFACPQQLRNAFAVGSPGLRLLVVTPALFGNGWLPDGFNHENGAWRGTLPGIDERVVLRAALVDRPMHHSGWDMTRPVKGKEHGVPKPTARAVAPGAVYYFEKEPAFERRSEVGFDAAELESLWFAAIGMSREEGFGRVAPGLWTPHGDTSRIER